MTRKMEIQVRRDTAANWTGTNPTLAAGEPGFETNTGKFKVGDGSTAWNSLGYIGGPGTGVTSLDSISGAVTLHAGTNIAITDNSPGAGQINIATTGVAGTIGSTSLVYRYTVTGSAKASIDTGVDTPNAGSNDWTNCDLLEVFVYGRTDEAVVASDGIIIFNNDASAIYDYQWSRLHGTTLTGVSNLAQTGIDFFVAANSIANTGTFGVFNMSIPNPTGTVANKVFTGQSVFSDPGDSTASNLIPMSGQYRSTSALTRLKLTVLTAGKNWKVGTQLLIYKRLAS